MKSTSCNSFASSVSSDCASRGDNHIRRQWLFKLKPKTEPELLLQKPDQDLSCKAPFDLEIDSKGNLYVTNYMDNRIERLGPGQELKTILENTEKSHAFSAASSAPPRSYFSPPIKLRVAEDTLYYQLFDGGVTIPDFRLRTADIETGQSHDLLVGGIYGMTGYYEYTVSHGKVYMFNLSSEKDGFSANENYVLEEYSKFPVGLHSEANKIALHLTPHILLTTYDLRRGPNGVFYLSDLRNHLIWTITLNADHTQGEMRILAGSGQKGYQDGKGSDASFSSPGSLALDGVGNLYVADMGNAAIRKINPAGVVTTFFKAAD